MPETPSPEESQTAPTPPAPPTPQSSAGIEAKIGTKLTHWKRRLLDLSKRNRLLNFKITPVSTIAVVDEEPAEIFRRLWLKDGTMRFKASPLRDAKSPEIAEGDKEPWAEEGDAPSAPFQPYESAQLADRHTDDVLQTALTSEQLDRSLRRIDDQARLTLEEQGVNTLFLAVGMLAYKESPDSEEFFRAPLILLPATLTRKSVRVGYVIQSSDDDLLVNPALAEYLRLNYHLELPPVPDADSVADDYDLSLWFSALADRIDRQPNWALQKNVYLGLFSFQKFLMYKDLEEHGPAFAAHRLIQQIVTRAGTALVGLPDDVRSVDLDVQYTPEDAVQVVDADSSQLRAMAAVTRGYDLVLEGPPGTGKSQTITNLIAHAMARGKSVLFVAEKMAALEVVHRRLVDAGLGEFCLEVHSTKANKRAVMQQIRMALDASLQRPPLPDVSVSRLKQLRDELTVYIKEVHRPHGTLGISPYRAYGELGKVIDAPKVPWSGAIAEVSFVALEDAERRLRDLALVAQEVGDVRTHPWRDTTRTFYSEADLDALTVTLTTTSGLLADLMSLAAEVETSLGLPAIKTLQDLSAASTTAELLRRSPGAPTDILKSDAWNVPPPAASRLVEAGRMVTDLRHRVATKLTHEALNQTHESDCDYVEKKSAGLLSWLAILDGRYRSIRRRWLSYRLPSYRPSLVDQVADMRTVDRYVHQRDALRSAQEAAIALFGGLWHGESSDWEALDKYIKWVVDFRKLCVTHALRETAYEHATRGRPDTSIVDRLVALGTKCTDMLQLARTAVGWPVEYLTSEGFVGIKARIDCLHDSIGLAPRWAGFEAAREAACNTLGKEVVGAAMTGEVPFDRAAPALRRSFLQRWLSDVISSRAELLRFQTITHEQRVQEFRRLDRAVLESNRALLVKSLRDTIQERLREATAAAAMPALRRELARQRSLSPLRRTMRNAYPAIRAIKPCFLMSPLSVAQLLDGGAPSFDLVIFDEASQLPPEDAVGAIIRGQQLVVVGDPKQLPPTNFFTVMSGQVMTTVDDDGTPIYEDTESVLEEYMGAGLPTGRLKWHYRSAHESLIAFSNVSFYDGDLYTFPSTDTATAQYGLHFEHVDDGVYEGKGLNLVEARRVADAVIDHAKRYPHLSLGVGTFNLRQQLAIQDELEVRRRQDPSVEDFFAKQSEPFFVKNLENIQGDERDVIFISVTYARAADGKLRYNFGPLNSQNGWRRLNVLITRAKKRMHVFSSIRSEDINPTATSTDGPRLLREFLAYAEHGRLDGQVVTKAADTESPFEHDVYLELSRRGLRLHPQVGVGGYRIDFGVLDNAVQGRFVCGIECDGVAYHSSETARDRDRLRHEVLEARGWEIHRIWSTDWFKDRAGQIDRLCRLIELSKVRCRQEASAEVEAHAQREQEQATQRALSDETVTANDLEGEPPPATADRYVRPKAESYQPAPVAGKYEGRDLLSESPGTVRGAVQTIVSAEAPLHFDDLAARVASMWGKKLGSRIEARIRQACREAEKTGALKMRGRFVWPLSGEFRVRSRAGSNIPGDRIPPEEYREATVMILRASAGMLKADLINEVRAVFGFARTGATLEASITAVVDELLSAGVVGEGSVGLMLRK